MKNSRDTFPITRLSDLLARKRVLPVVQSVPSAEDITLLAFTGGSVTSARIADRGLRPRSKRSSLMTKEELFKIIGDRFDAAELVDLLEIDVEAICRSFEDELFENIEEIKELLDLDTDDEEDEWTSDYDQSE